jgi:branched-chain amino acid transport system ATP-binding protein
MSEWRPLSLSVQGLSVRYGLSQALENVSLVVPAGGVTAVIGANGAGKSTLLKAVTGLVEKVSGEIRVEEKMTAGWPPRKVAELGVALVPEGRRVFRSLTVEENLLMGSYVHRRGEEIRLKEVYDAFPVLAQRRRQSGGTLSGGEQQMLAIGRALMANPGLLLLDEPSLGLAPRIVSTVFSSLAELHRDRGVTIVLIEQNARQALRLATSAVLLETGRVVATGTPDELKSDHRLEAAYFGPTK